MEPCYHKSTKETYDRARYDGVFGDNLGYFLLILHKIYVVTPPLNRLDETVQIRGHNIWFQ